MLVAATVHFPYMTAFPERASEAVRLAARAGFSRLGHAFASAGIDTIIAVTSEHIVNLQPRLAPAFTLGIGEHHAAFPEPQFNLQPVTRRGDPSFAGELIAALYRRGFEPAHSSELRLDHGTSLPLEMMGIDSDVAVIPLIINSIFPPLPMLARCAQLGTAIAAAVAESKLPRRVGLLATGGISHIVGGPGMQYNDSTFDEDFLSAIKGGQIDRACRYSDTVLDAAGNGTHEIRNWIVAAAAASPRVPEVVTAIRFAEGWDSGVHQFLWEAP